METDKPNRSGGLVFAPSPGESVSDHRARVALRQAEALELRQRELAEQASDANAPAARIKIWERLHQIGLPASPSHRILDVIAADTRLSVEEVRFEQRQRRHSSIRAEP
jgi:hypothetical protein